MAQELKPKVVIIILNWNGWQDTIECLESVQRLSYPDYHIVLVDNGSSNDSVEKIKEWCQGKITVSTDFFPFSHESKPVKYIEYDRKTAEHGGLSQKEDELIKYPPNRKLIFIQTDENLGFAEGNNVGIRYALNCSHPADFVFLLNNDTWIEPNCIFHSVEVSRRKNSSVVGCVVKDIESGEMLFSGDRRRSELFYVPYLFFRHKLNSDRPSNVVWGTAMLIRRDALISHENLYGYYFNPKLYLYMEDYEFCIDIRKMGYEIFVSKKAVVYHKKSQSYVSRKFQNSILHYYLTRNMILLARNLLSGVWLAFFQIYYPIARIKDFIKKLMEGKKNEAAAIIEGLLDGYHNVYGKWEKHP